MDIKTIQKNGVKIAVVRSDEALITSVETALDLMATARYETDCDCIALYKESIAEEFFELKTGLAGDVLQKYVNYGLKFAVIGDFSIYSSNALKDFIYECNRGNSVFFVATEEEAVEKLAV